MHEGQRAIAVIKAAGKLSQFGGSSEPIGEFAEPGNNGVIDDVSSDDDGGGDVENFSKHAAELAAADEIKGQNPEPVLRAVAGAEGEGREKDEQT